MGLRIIISSAVKLKEKDCVKTKLREMREKNIINFDDNDLYDCNEHGIYWDKDSNQDIIDGIIKKVDWFICLIPKYTVGEETWKELKERLEAKRDGSPVVISVFHPLIPSNLKCDIAPNGEVTFDTILSETDRILGNKKKQYEVRYEYGNHEDLKNQLEDQYLKLYNKDKVFWSQHIGYYAKRGSDVKAQEMYFDTERASEEWGFREGKNVYIWRNSVDGKIKLAMDNYDLKYLFVTGKPSSGKSRAIYELLHSTLKEKQVVVMQYKNVSSICQNLQIEVEQLDNGGKFQNNDYYFVCDQINDVFQKARVPKELKLSFLRNIAERDNCYLIATGTRASLDGFIEDSEGIISSPDKKRYGGNSELVSIPLISNDSESHEILERLKHRYAVDTGETIGDFITEINSHKTRIVDEILCSVDKYEYLRNTLKSIQLTLNYRHITPLLLPITILRQYYINNDSKTFKEKTIDCIDFLIDKNVIKITNVKEEEEINKFPQNRFSGLSEPTETIIDDERYLKYVPNFYTFTVNELIWEHLEKRSMESKENAIFYNLFDCDELIEASGYLFKSYSHAATLRRIVSRVPLRRDFRDREGDKLRKQMTWEFSMEKIKKIDFTCEPKIEMLKVFNILIGRSRNVAEIDDLLSLMKGNDIETDCSTIGEMYYFAQNNLQFGTYDFTNFINKTNKLYEEQLRRDSLRGCAWTYHVFYKINREIVLKSHNNKDYKYIDAFNIVSNVFSKLTYTTPAGTTLRKGKESVKAIGNLRNTIERRSLDALMVKLAKLCKNSKEIKQLIQCHQHYEIEPSNVMLHQIGKILKDVNKLKDVLRVLFPNKATKLANSVLYERAIACFMPYLRTFKESAELYKTLHNDLDMGDKHNTKLISLCLKNCGTEELQSAIAFIDKLPENAVNGITYNILIALAANKEDAMYLVKKMQPEDIDEYTLCNCLKCVETIQQKNYRRDSKKVPPLQIFLFAYEFINHPLLKNKRTREACLQKLYKLTSDSYQEEYINRIISDKKRLFALRYNDYINATRIMRDFRTFSDAWERIYYPAKQKYDETSGTIMPDLFNNICAKYYKDMKENKIDSQPKAIQYRKELQEDIERGIRRKRIIQDEFFFLNYYIKFLGKDLFHSNGDAMSPLFMDWFERRVGNYNPENITILSRYLDYIVDMTEATPETKWKMASTIYKLYEQYFIQWNLIFKPSDAVYATLLKIVKDCKDVEEKYKFIDSELEELDIDRTIKLNFYLNKVGKLYDFQYNNSHPHKENRQINNLTRINKAETAEDIIKVLQNEINIEGFVAPSILNHALEKYRIFQTVHANEVKEFLSFVKRYIPENASKFNLCFLVMRYMKVNKQKQEDVTESIKLLKIIRDYHPRSKNFKNLKKEIENIKDSLGETQYQEIVKFIQYNHLEKSLTLKGRALLSFLTKNDTERIKHLNSLEQYKDIDINVYGQLAKELVIANTSISHSRMFFRKWLDTFREIYCNDESLTIFLSQKENEEKWKTIGLHLKNEVFALSRIHRDSHLPAEATHEKLYDYMRNNNITETLDVIAEILRLYYLQPKYFLKKNFNQYITFEDVIALLKIHIPGNWQEIYDILNSPKAEV